VLNLEVTSSDVDLAPVARQAAGLRLLVLYGSRARTDARPGSDWDFGYLADPDFDPDALLAALVEHLHADRVDLADLATSTGQLRYQVARDARVLFDRTGGEWSAFWMAAVGFWCDAGPVIDAAYASVLTELGR
jgi:predicted nucleotidyltransferase